MRLLAEAIMLHADSGLRCLACPVFVWVAPRVAVGRVSLGLPPACHMTLEMSVRSMKSNWEFGIMAGQPHMGTIRKTTLEKISPQFSFYAMKVALFYPFCYLIAVLEFTFCPFSPKNCGEIFSNVVFLKVPRCSYPAMMPNSKSDFMLTTDISNSMCLQIFSLG